MKILDLIIDSLKIEDQEIKKVIIGLYTTYVANNKQAGLSSTLYFSNNEGEHGHKHFNIKDAGELESKNGIDLCRYVYSDLIIEASIGMAAINSHIRINFDKCEEINALKIILEKGENKNIAVIGHFPFVKKIKSVAKNLFIFELSPKDKDDLLPEQMPEYLPRADVIAITGTSFLNNTFQDILKNSRKDAYRLILGPSTPMSEILFDFNIDALCGSYVENSSCVEAYISQAVPFKFIKGVRHLTMMRSAAYKKKSGFILTD